MRKYKMIQLLDELRKQRDGLLEKLSKNPRNDALKGKIFSISEEITLLETNIASFDQQVDEGWPIDQE